MRKLRWLLGLALATVALPGNSGLAAHSVTPPPALVASASVPPPAALLASCAATPPPSQSLPGAQTRVYRTLGERTLRIHVFQPRGEARARPAVLMFFGGGFTGGDALSLAGHAQRFAEKGYVAVIADYRVFCRDRTFPNAGVDDAAAAYAWLRGHARELGIDRRRMVMVGGSAGGLLAASAALRQPANARPAALVLFNPVVDISGDILSRGLPNAAAAEPGLSERTLRAISPTTMPLAALPPTIIFHGTADKLVPFATVEAFCAKAQAAGRVCRLERYPGYGHSFYQRRDPVPPLGIVPFEDTMAKALTFLDGLAPTR